MWSLLSAVTTSCIAEEEPAEWSLAPGDRLPTFSVTTLDGTDISQASFEGKEGYIVFFTTTCGDCRRELPIMEEHYRQLTATPEGREHVEFICISRGDDAATVRDYWEANGLTMPVAAPGDKGVYYLFASVGVPRLYVTRGEVIEGVYVERLMFH